MDFQALKEFIAIYAPKKFNVNVYVDGVKNKFSGIVMSAFGQSLDKDTKGYYQRLITKASDEEREFDISVFTEYGDIYKAYSKVFLKQLLGDLARHGVIIPEEDWEAHTHLQEQATTAMFSNSTSLKEARAKEEAAARAVKPKVEQVKPLNLNPEESAKRVAAKKASGTSTKKTTSKKTSGSTKKTTNTSKTASKKEESVKNTVVNYPMVVGSTGFGSPMGGMFNTGSSQRFVEAEIVNDIPTQSGGVMPYGADVRALYAMMYMQYLKHRQRRMGGSSTMNIPGAGDPMRIAGGSTIYALPEHGSGRYGTTSNMSDASVSDYLKDKAKQAKLDEARSRLGRHIESSGVIKMGTTFKQGEEEAKKKQGRQKFINELLSGINKIMGKNPLWDLIRLGILILGKNHPILAAIALTLPTLIGPVRGLWSLIKGVNRGLLAMGKFWNKIPKVGVGEGFKAFFGKGGKFGGSILNGAGNLGKIARFGARMGGPLSGLLSFGINKAMGQSTGEAASRATGSTIGGVLGGALGAFAGPVGIAVGSVIGGLLGDWIGGKLFGLLNKNKDEQNKRLDDIERNTSWLERLCNWWKNKFGDGSGSNGNPAGLGSYGDVRPDATSVTTMTADEKAKLEKQYKYDLEMYKAAKDNKIAGWGRGGLTKARDVLVENWKKDYANREINKNMYAPGSLKRDIDYANFYASPEAKKYAEEKLAGYLNGTEHARLTNLRARLDNSVIVDSKYGNVPSTLKTSTVNGIPAVALSDLGITGQIKGDKEANKYIGAGRVGRMKELDNVFRKYGVNYKITSTMGDSHETGGKSHGAGNKIDIVPVGNISSSTKSELEKELARTGFYGGNTGAVGWHNAGSGYHWDLSLLTSSELKRLGNQLNSTQKAVQTATTEEAQSNAVASNFLRQSINDRVYGKDNSLRKANEIIFTATDVTGSLGVWGITQVNNTGKMRT